MPEPSQKLEPELTDEDPLPRAYLLAGQAYLGLRDMAGADSMLAKLSNVEPTCADLVNELRFNAWVPLYNMGINSLRTDDQAAALDAFLRANVIFPDSRSLTNAANILQQQGENAKAMELYEQALDIGGDPDMVRAASINLAELLRMEGQRGGSAGHLLRLRVRAPGRCPRTAQLRRRPDGFRRSGGRWQAVRGTSWSG